MTAPAVAVRWWDHTVPLARCAALAALTARAYTGSDPRPGLPPPDGARERARDVRARLDTGHRYAVLAGPAGDPAGAACVAPGAAGLHVARIVTDPRWRGRGVLAALLAAVATRAHELGAPAVLLDAVVERCLPTVYLRHGFRPLRWWRAPDKPLCEVTMRRPVPGAAPPAVVDPLPDAPGARAVVWSPGRGGTVVPADRHDADPATPVAGVDLRHDGDDVVARGPQDGTDDAFLAPRRRLPGALTLWRAAPGRERPLHELTAVLPSTDRPSGVLP